MNPIDPTSYARFNKIRQNLWEGGAKGLAGGLIGGGVIYQGLKMTNLSAMKKMGSKNHLTAAVLIGGAIGMFLGSVTAGKNAMSTEGDLFTGSANPDSAYQSKMLENEKDIRQNMDAAFLRRQAAIARAVKLKNEGGSGGRSF
jgi:hypothetical protein